MSQPLKLTALVIVKKHCSHTFRFRQHYYYIFVKLILSTSVGYVRTDKKYKQIKYRFTDKLTRDIDTYVKFTCLSTLNVILMWLGYINPESA